MKDPEIKDLILKHLYKINLAEFLIKLGKDANEYASRILENIPRDKISEVFEGLQEADALELLSNLLIKSSDREIKMRAAWALAVGSGKTVFFRFLDTVQLKNVSPADVKIMEARVNKYKWKKRDPNYLAPNAQKLFFLISYYASQLVISNNFDRFFYSQTHKIHNWLRYLISAEIHSCKFSFHKYNLIGYQIRATKFGLISHWRERIHSNVVQIVLFLLPYCIISITGMVKHWNTNLSLKIIGITTMIALLCMLISLMLKTKKTSLEDALYIPIFLFMLHFLLIIPFRLFVTSSDYKAKELWYILTISAVLSSIFYFVPIPMFYKVAHLSIIACLLSIALLKLFIHPWGRWFPNEEVHVFLNGED